MTTLIQLKADLLDARRTSDMAIANILSTLVGELEGKAVVVNGVKTVDELTVASTIKKFIKGLEEVLSHRPQDTKSAWEKEFLLKYLPQQLSDHDLEMYALENQRLPEYMKFLKDNFAGQYDGKRASEIYKRTYA